MFTALNLDVGAGGYAESEGRLRENACVSTAQMAYRLGLIGDLERVFVADAGERALGFVSLRLAPYMDQDVPYAEVTQLFVEPEARRSGVGLVLMDAAAAFAAEAGATSIVVRTGAGNSQAQTFYRKAGYAPEYVAFEKFLTKPEGVMAHA
jgi:GNAT superfamily N-acetyltransferase